MRIAAMATSAVLLLLASAANAQVLCWTTKEGKKACGDTPPAGAKVTTYGSGAPATPPPAPADASGKAAAKKPPADPEQEFKKRQADASKAREKEEQTQQQAQAKAENCDRARNALRILESGQRISRVDKEGERYYLEEKEIEAETQRARDNVTRNCS